MNLEQPCIRISVRNLVEFILRHGDIDNRTGGADKEAMQQGGRIHPKIPRQQGGEYRAEGSVKYQIACDGFIPVSYTHLRAHETDSYFVCRLLL